jgi:preprotein translocase subunit SecA
MKTGNNRAVLIFFKNELKLEEFRQSRNFKDSYGHRTLTEKIEDLNEKERIIFYATQPESITLATPNFGRGTDFICRNEEVENNYGLHVILTFMCTQNSEFV